MAAAEIIDALTGGSILRDRWRRWGSAATAVLIALLPAGRALAHPHVWVLYAMNLEMQNRTAVAIDEEWTFAEGFSALVDVDLSHYPKNGVLSAQDAAALRRTAFDSLKDVDYFTRIFVQGRAVPLGEPQRFTAAMRDGKLVYTFRRALTQPVDVSQNPLELGTWDDEFFVDFEMKKNGVNAIGTKAACRVFYTQDPNHAVYYGTYPPMAATVVC
jgi:ABC-type uncharacterized transport system substrate-binding protein